MDTTSLFIENFNNRDMLYSMIGARYNRLWGARVVGWFMEESIKTGKNQWTSRYHMYSIALKREVPLSSLYLILGRLTADGILEMKMEDRTHYFKLGENTMGAMSALSNLYDDVCPDP